MKYSIKGASKLDSVEFLLIWTSAEWLEDRRPETMRNYQDESIRMLKGKTRPRGSKESCPLLFARKVYFIWNVYRYLQYIVCRVPSTSLFICNGRNRRRVKKLLWPLLCFQKRVFLSEGNILPMINVDHEVFFTSYRSYAPFGKAIVEF